MLLPAAVGAVEPLTNADVLKLVQAKLSAPVIVQTIKTAPTASFSLAPDDLIALKAKGVPDAVISAMLDRTTPVVVPNATTVTAGASVVVRIVKGGRQDWPLWSRRAGDGAAVGVLFVPDATWQLQTEALAAIEAYNEHEQGTLVVGGGRDTFSFYSLDCYRMRADSCNKWDRVQFDGAKWEPPSQATVPISASTTSLGAVAVILGANGKLRVLDQDSWIQDTRRMNLTRCNTRYWATTRIPPGGVTLTSSMEVDYERPMGIVVAACIGPQLTFN